MKPRDPNVEWVKKILADIERYRSDPQIAALMDIRSAPESPHESAVEHAGLPLLRGVE